MAKGTLLLTLRVFSATGGIEKVCRVAGKALYELGVESGSEDVSIYSMYDNDDEASDQYFPVKIFKGFGKSKISFVTAAVSKGIKCDRVILSHVNLLLVGFLVKLLSPKTKLVLIAHGIEVWRPFSGWKLRMLRTCSLILPVSKFTKNKMMELYGLPAEKFNVLNNCLDPFLAPPEPAATKTQLRKKYNIAETDIVLMSLTRLSSKEKYKGYDQVLMSIKDLQPTFPSVKYLVVGKYDDLEKKRLDKMISELQLEGHIVFTGFIADEELAAHYAVADVYIMPSQKEGFGIVFIEALYYGKPVIAGNKDGSVDALKNGDLGLLINPDSREEITSALLKVLSNTHQYVPDHQHVMSNFGYDVYKQNWGKVLQKLKTK